ncbi:MAG: dTMP kinase [Synergistaceae bacterium]|nr:dTMP kinase [Synergistaceae bacterium]
MFITFEGIDGSGKSTQASLFWKWLVEDKKRDALLTREPGGWPGGDVLRKIVVSGKLKHEWSEAYLFMLDRAEHIAAVIQPAIDSGRDVVCERYHDSTLAYQIWGRGLPLEIFDELARLSEFPVPDLTILFDISPVIALKRVKSRGTPDSFEKEGESFMTKIRDGYLALSKRDPKRWLIVECSEKSSEEIFEQMTRSLMSRGLFCDK